MKINTIQPIEDRIMFVFTQEITGGQAVEKTEWGFEFAVSKNNTAQPPRWGKIVAVGPDVNAHLPDDFKMSAGDTILIEPLMWTESYDDQDGEKFWFTSLEKVMMIADASMDTSRVA